MAISAIPKGNHPVILPSGAYLASGFAVIFAGDWKGCVV